MRSAILKGLATLLIVFSLVACAGKNKKLFTEAPEWIKRGTGAFLDRDQHAFYGIGAITGIENKPLGRMAADTRARGEVVRLFETYVGTIGRAFSPEAGIDDLNRRDEVLAVPQGLNAISETTLSEIVILDHWIDLSDGVFYSLARLDLGRFKENIKSARDLDPALRVYVMEHADAVFENLDAGKGRRP